MQRASRCIPVTRIDAKGTMQIISDLLKAESVPRRLVEFVYGQSEGLPIHIEHLVLSLQEHGLIEARDGKCVVHASDLTTSAVPHKLRDLVVGLDVRDLLGGVARALDLARGRGELGDRRHRAAGDHEPGEQREAGPAEDADDEEDA